MEELISIIVPVYNVRDYLYECIFSIMHQTYHNLEIIIVDDGSTDGSAQLCDELARMDERIKVVHKENGGLVSARKAGIKLAEGIYVLNIDSDDWIEDDMVEQLLGLAVANDSDIVTSGYYAHFGEKAVEKADTLPEGNYNSDAEKYFLYHRLITNNGEIGINVPIWCKLVRTDLLKNIYLQMSDAIRMGEDAAFVYSCIALAKRITVSHEKYYHYRVRENSISRSVSRSYYREINDVLVFIEKHFKENKYKAELKRQLDYHTVVLCLLGIEKHFGVGTEFVIPRYSFPLNIIPQGSKVIVYGAGAVGKSYYKKIKLDKLYDLVQWVDKKYLDYQNQGMHVCPVAAISEQPFDYILLALLDSMLAEQVKNELEKEYDIPEDKIIWFKPVDIVAESMNN